MLVRGALLLNLTLLAGCAEFEVVDPADRWPEPVQPYQCQGDGARFGCAHKWPGYTEDYRLRRRK